MNSFIKKILSDRSARTSVALTALTAATMSPWDALA